MASFFRSPARELSKVVFYSGDRRTTRSVVLNKEHVNIDKEDEYVVYAGTLIGHFRKSDGSVDRKPLPVARLTADSAASATTVTVDSRLVTLFNVGDTLEFPVPCAIIDGSSIVAATEYDIVRNGVTDNFTGTDYGATDAVTSSAALADFITNKASGAIGSDLEAFALGTDVYVFSHQSLTSGTPSSISFGETLSLTESTFDTTFTSVTITAIDVTTNELTLSAGLSIGLPAGTPIQSAGVVNVLGILGEDTVLSKEYPQVDVGLHTEGYLWAKSIPFWGDFVHNTFLQGLYADVQYAETFGD